MSHHHIIETRSDGYEEAILSVSLLLVHLIQSHSAIRFLTFKVYMENWAPSIFVIAYVIFITGWLYFTNPSTLYIIELMCFLLIYAST